MGTVTQPCTQYGGAWEPSLQKLYPTDYANGARASYDKVKYFDDVIGSRLVENIIINVMVFRYILRYY